MADGYLNKCKDCAKQDTKKNRSQKKDYYSEYDRKRADLPHRKLLRDKICYKWKTDPELKKITAEKRRAWVQNNHVKRAAHIITNNAIRKGHLIKCPCEICGAIEKIEAHHDNYEEPLNVRWLCRPHHVEHHKILKEKIRNEKC